ncbi:MAG: ATP-binding protein [Chloroflexota bacterium]
MDALQLQQRVKFAEYVWHDQAYLHPQLKTAQPKDFYGRQEAIQKAKTALRLSSRPVIFIGERRAGKTSIFKLIMRSLRNKSDFIPVEISWLEVHSAPELMREILASIYEKLALSNEALLNAFEKAHSPAEFRHVMQGMLENSGKIVALGIDEFDALLFEQSEEERKKIIGAVISLVESDEFPVRVILTMTREPASIETGYTSPLTTKSEKIRLEPFSKTEMDEMLIGILENQIPISEQERNEVFNLSGGWPYFAKALLYYWVETIGRDDALRLAMEKAIQDTGLGDAIEHIYLKHLSPSERTILLALAKLGGKINAKEKSTLDVSIKAAAQVLIKRGYVVERNDGYEFRVALMLDWFCRWARFEEQAEQYAAEVLIAIERQKDPWAGIQRDDIFNGIADEEA